MIVGLGFLALFFVLSTALGYEDPRSEADPKDYMALFTRFSGR